jgi:hypothetical protein
MKRPLSLFLIALTALLPQLASADTTIGTAILALPHKITKPGAYRLTKRLAYSVLSGAAITIEATDVVIDLNGFELIAVSGSTNTAAGIECSAQSRVTIKDGTIRGFQNGVVLGSDDVLITDLLVTNCLQSGISVIGNHSQIIHNRVYDIGGSGNGSPTAIGITVTGTYGIVSNNDVQSIFETDNSSRTADGIRIHGSSNIIVTNNHVLDVEPQAPTKATSNGISIDPAAPSSVLVVLGNIVLTTGTPFDLTGGLSGEYGDNVTANFTAPSAYVITGTNMTSIDSNN